MVNRRVRNSVSSLISLQKEREDNWIPLVKSPFVERPSDAPEPEELRVNRAEVPWSDLLLEVAMATTFAGLTDGTPVLRPSNVVSYTSFFALVWWIWASQVAYNVRFRQPDWLHRFFVFLQLLVFAALSAFTNKFDITDGIRSDRDQERILELQSANQMSTADLNAEAYRNQRMPTLNARGISMVVALSRLLLFVQYCLALYHARRSGKTRCHALFIHLGSLVVSCACYVGAFIVIGKDPNMFDNVLKLVLWFIPIVLEALAHFLANTLPGKVRYEPEAVYARAATAFVIILGGGLDKITNSFQYIIGNVSFGRKGAGLIFSAMVIVTAQFSLYFGMSENSRPSNNRALAWFFSQWLYLTALIVTLQAVAALLVFGNIGTALLLPIDLVSKLGQALRASPGVELDASSFVKDFKRPLSKIGVSLETVIENVNVGVRKGLEVQTGPEAGVNGTNIAYNYILQQGVETVSVILQNFNTMPDDGTLLGAEIKAFLENDASNMTSVNNGTFTDIIEEVFYFRGQPALWFYGAAGCTFVFLAMMMLIIRRPRDKFEWYTVLLRLFTGLCVIAMAGLDFGAGEPLINDQLEYSGSMIWRLALKSWVLPPFAIIVFVEQLIELVLVVLAGRPLRRITGVTFGHGSRRSSVQTQSIPGLGPLSLNLIPPTPVQLNYGSAPWNTGPLQDGLYDTPLGGQRGGDTKGQYATPVGLSGMYTYEPFGSPLPERRAGFVHDARSGGGHYSRLSTSSVSDDRWVDESINLNATPIIRHGTHPDEDGGWRRRGRYNGNGRGVHFSR